jgi:hypothetical protein
MPDSSPAADEGEPIDIECTAADNAAELTLSVNTIRVAINGAIADGAPLVIQRLKMGEPLPAGTMEAMLVLTGEFAGPKTNRNRVSSVYRIIEVWKERCGTVITRYSEKALRFFGLTRLRSPH